MSIKAQKSDGIEVDALDRISLLLFNALVVRRNHCEADVQPRLAFVAIERRNIGDPELRAGARVIVRRVFTPLLIALKLIAFVCCYCFDIYTPSERGVGRSKTPNCHAFFLCLHQHYARNNVTVHVRSCGNSR